MCIFQNSTCLSDYCDLQVIYKNDIYGSSSKANKTINKIIVVTAH